MAIWEIRYTKLMDNFQIQKVLDYTEDKTKYFVDDKATRFAYYYRIYALIIINRLDEAELLCYDVIDGSSDEHIINNMNYFLAVIFFNKEEYLKSLYYHKLAHAYEDHEKYVMDMLSFIGSTNNYKLKRKLLNVPKVKLVNHVRSRHDDHFDANLNVLINLIKNNFDKAPTYNDVYSKFKLFRCSGIGNSDFNTTSKLCDYIKVVCKNNSKDSIVTIFPIVSCGSLECFDITKDYYKSIENNEEKKLSGKKVMDKFNQRQLKRSNLK